MIFNIQNFLHPTSLSNHDSLIQFNILFISILVSWVKAAETDILVYQFPVGKGDLGDPYKIGDTIIREMED